MQCDLSKIEMWANKWLMTCNTTNVRYYIVYKITLNNNPYLYNYKLFRVAKAKYLDVTLDSKLTFNMHVCNL